MQLIKIFISSGHDYWVRSGERTLQYGTQSPAEVRCEAGKGLVGDRYYHGKPSQRGQVTFMDLAVIEEIMAEFQLPDLTG